ncbi:MAG: carboxymuconolactone decarboxylase family protein [Hyphomonadaceae bacterium]
MTRIDTQDVAAVTQSLKGMKGALAAFILASATRDLAPGSRALLSFAALKALGHEREARAAFAAAIETGCSGEEIMRAMDQGQRLSRFARVQAPLASAA